MRRRVADELIVDFTSGGKTEGVPVQEVLKLMRKICHERQGKNVRRKKLM